MFASACRRLPAGLVRVAILPVFVSVGALGQAGCAANGFASNAATPAVAAQVAEATHVVIEDDGLPSQAAPSPRIRQMPDDPSQPFSRNYGGRNPAASGPADHEPERRAAHTADIPADLPPGFRRQLLAAIDTGN